MKNTAILIYNQMELLDMSGIQTALFMANQKAPGSYRLSTVGFDSEPVTCESGTRLLPDSTLEEIEDYHTLIIPGGVGARLRELSDQQRQQLTDCIHACERVVTICTGIFMLAKTGLCDGLNVATHWAFVEQLRCNFPSLIVDKDKLFVRDKQFWSSAGVTSGIDLALRLIELDINKAVAIDVAQYLVVYLKRSGSQQQFSGVLDLQSPKSDVIANVINWIKSNLHRPISVQQMADEANLSERQFRRLFMRDTNKTPANFLEEMRMDSAKNLLLNSDKSIKHLALTLGFHSADGFRRAFERKYKVSPSRYRNMFTGKDQAAES